MSIESAVIARLKATAAVTALVSTRVWNLILPQKPTLPAIRVQIVTDPQIQHLRGSVDAAPARVQVDCYGAEANGYAPVEAIADAVDTALTGEPFTSGGRKILSVERVDRRAMFEAGELRLVRMLLDYRIWSKD